MKQARPHFLGGARGAHCSLEIRAVLDERQQHCHRNDLPGRADQFRAAERRCAFQERMVMHLRVAAFLVAAAMFIVGWNSRQTWWFVAGGVAVGGFSAAVAWHEYIRSQMLRNLLFRQVNEQAIARLGATGRACRKRGSKCRRNTGPWPPTSTSSAMPRCFTCSVRPTRRWASACSATGSWSRPRPIKSHEGNVPQPSWRRTWTCGKR